MRLELGKCHFDRIEIGRIGRQVAEFGTGSLDHASDAIDLMGRQVIHHDDISGPEFRHEAALDIGQEDISVGRAVDHEGSDQAARAEPGNEGGRLPVSKGHSPDNPGPLGAAPTRSRHIGRGSRLVDEDQTRRIKRWLAFPPRVTRRLDVRTLLFAGMNRFF